MESILFSLDRGVATLSLNRPDVLNSFNREMSLNLIKFLQRCREDDVRAVLLKAEGRAFCAGQDLAEAMSPDGPGLRKIVKEHYNQIILNIRNLEKPVVCAVNGVAAGAGANIAFACDIILAGKSASFIQAFSKIGLIPDSGGTFTLPRLVGYHRAAALMMTGDKVNAETALAWGMVYKVYEDEQLQEEATKLATQLAMMPTKGLGLTKKALNASFSNNLEQQLDVEEDLQVMAGGTHDFNEGVQAFLEKRKPNFTGA